MVIDTSALLAILEDEPERRSFNEAIETAGTRVLSVPTTYFPARQVARNAGSRTISHERNQGAAGLISVLEKSSPTNRSASRDDLAVA